MVEGKEKKLPYSVIPELCQKVSLWRGDITTLEVDAIDMDLSIYLPSHKEAVKKTVPTYAHTYYNGAILWFYCYRNIIEYRDNSVNISWNIVIMVFLLSHRPNTGTPQTHA